MEIREAGDHSEKKVTLLMIDLKSLLAGVTSEITKVGF